MTVQALVLALLLGLHYRTVLASLVNAWLTNGDWSHGFIIPLFSLYYLYMHRDRMPLALPDKAWSSRLVGAGLLTAAFALMMFSTLIMPQDYLKRVSLVMSVAGALMMVCGWPLTRWSWFAVAFLFFALPLPQEPYVAMTMPLRYIAAKVSALVLRVIPDMQTQAAGALVEYQYHNVSGTLDIEHACSGIRLMMTMMALGVAMAFVSERPAWQRLAMIISCVPIAIFCNIIRVTTTGFFVVFERKDLAEGHWHTMLGLGMLFIAFGLYGLVSYVLNNLVVDEPREQPVEPIAVGGSPS